MHLDNVREHINEPKVLAKLLLHILVPVGIIHIQGDDGTGIVFATIGCMIAVASFPGNISSAPSRWARRAWRRF